MTRHQWDAPKARGATATCVNCGLHRKRTRKQRRSTDYDPALGPTYVMDEYLEPRSADSDGSTTAWSYYKPKCREAKQ